MGKRIDSAEAALVAKVCELQRQVCEYDRFVKDLLLMLVCGDADSNPVLWDVPESSPVDVVFDKVKELADLRLDEMGFIFQQMYMLKNLTVLDNIILPAVQSNKNTETRKEIVRRGQDLMRKLGIIEIADNDINEVSGGQLQRACICRSMINNPKMIFADEPTGALNRTSSDEVMEELAKLNADGTTVMLVTHDVKVAAKCTRVMYIVDGNIRDEYNLGRCESNSQVRERERALNNRLLELGW